MDLSLTFHRLSIILLVIITIGCAEATRPAGAPSGVMTLAPWGSVVKGTSVQRPVVHGDKPEILVISGGGASIAYTSGLINGWAARGDLPDFDVVTGVSAGALISTLVFIGKDYHDLLREATIFKGADDIIQRRSIFDIVFNDSLGSSDPLSRRIHHFITDKVLARVADKHRRGYRLFVGSTDLDNQKRVVWDLGAIAASNHKHKRKIYIQAILASASVPVLFNPVYIPVKGDDGKTYHTMHVDGGVMGNMLLSDYMLPKRGKNGRVHIIHNATVSSDKQKTPVKPRLLSISESVFDTSFSNTFSLLTDIELADVKSHRFKSFKMTSIPVQLINQIKQETGQPYNSLSFSAQATSLLYKKSYALAKAGKIVWDEKLK